MGISDDFLVSNGADYDTKCNHDGEIWYDDIILPFGAALSSACYLYLMWMYFVLKTPVLKRHPTTLAIYKCIFEFAFIQQYLWSPFLKTSAFYDDDAMDTNIAPYFCNASNMAGWLSFLTQFTLLGSELCFLIISLDLRMAYTNPFSSYRQNRLYFGSIVFGISLATSLALMAMGDQVYGLSSLGISWIQDRRETLSPSWAKMILFYWILIAIFIYCLWANFQFNKNDEKGFSKTVSNRINIMLRSKKYTVGYVAFGGVVLFLEFISFLAAANETKVGPLPAYFYCFRGIWALLVILYSNWSELSWKYMNPFRLKEPESSLAESVAQEGLLLQPHLNSALRAEILHFTTQGIMYAARELESHNRTHDNNRHSHDANSHGKGKEDEITPAQQALNDESDLRESRMFTFDEPGGGRSNRPSEQTEASLNSNNKRLSTTPSFLQRRASARDPSSNNNSNGAGGEEDLESGSSARNTFSSTIGMHRDTITEIDRVMKEQSALVNLIMEEALTDELEALGLGSQAIRSSLSNRNPVMGQQTQQQQQSVGINRPISMSVQKTLQSQKNDNNNNVSNGNLSGNDGPIDISNGHNSTRSPMFLSSNDRESGAVEMRSSSPSRMSGLSENSGCASDTSEATVKWRDTMDIEFSMRQSMDRKAAGGGHAGDLPRWHRVDSVGNHSQSTENIRMKSEESATSTSDRIKKGLQNALLNAKSVFAPAYYDFRFKDFCPKLFAKVRQMCNIDAHEYAKSFETTCRESFSEGRSGAFMFFSSDQRCIVKTTAKSELLALHAMMPKYVAHLQANPNSLICRFLGAHCITMYGVELYFVIMLNFFPNFPMSERYDLKGSWVNRHGSVENRKTRDRSHERRRETSARGSSPLYQDNDLQYKFSLQPEVTHNLAEQIKSDINFLKALNFMDYSLLIGVKREKFTVMASTSSTNSLKHRTDSQIADEMGLQRRVTGEQIETAGGGVSKPAWKMFGDGTEDAFQRDGDGGMRARIVEGPGTYYVGIIDILQEWNYTKRMERFLKTYVKLLDGDGLSAIQPTFYADRFWKRCVVDTFEGIEYDDNYINVRSPSTPFITSTNTSTRNTAHSDLSVSAQSGVSLRGTYGDSSGQFAMASSE